MKKKIYAILLGITLITGSLCGCGSKQEPVSSPEDTTESDSNQVVDEPDESEVPDETVEEAVVDEADPSESSGGVTAESTFADFLAGKNTLQTAEIFQPTEEWGNEYGIPYGQYNVSELKSAFDSTSVSDTEILSATADLNGDGVEELLLRFEAITPGEMNWTGIIRYKEDASLELSYSYMDGYRTDATMYEGGTLVIGGSWGAGASGYDYYRFDENCQAVKLFSCNTFFGVFATQIGYDLTIEEVDLGDDYELLGNNSTLEITEYVPHENGDTGVKISVAGYSTDETIEDAEIRMVDTIANLGAELVTAETMAELTSLDQGESIQWKKYE